MKKIIAFDFGGVLGTDADEWDTFFKPVLNITGLTAEEITSIFNKHWPLLKVGKMPIQNYWREIGTKNNIDPKDIREIYNSCIHLDEKIMNFAKSLRNKHKLVIISNDAKDWMDAKIEKFHLDNIFSKIYSSANLGISKPNKEIFTYVLNDLGIKPNELIFIDNQLNNYESAKLMGINAIHFTNLQNLKRDINKYL